jgi:predicted HAD superfamily phosphohydrolase YqeG
VGDRVLTDIYLGNLIGAKSYLIKPLEKTTLKKHGLGVFMMRWLENFMIKGMENRPI